MKRRLLMCAAILGITSSICGCGLLPEIPDLTEEQADLITEYSANLILKHQSVNYGLLTEEQLAEAEKKEKEAIEKAERRKQLAEEYLAKTEASRKEKESKKSDKDKKKDSDSVDVPSGPAEISTGKLAEFCGVEGFDVNYSGYDLVDSYPADGNSSMFAIDASQGNKLCVVKFDVSNVSGQDAEFNMFDKQSSFELTVNDGNTFINDTTLLMDDFSMYKGTIEAGKGTGMVLLFEVSDGTDINSLSMKVNAGNNSGKIELK